MKLNKRGKRAPPFWCCQGFFTGSTKKEVMGNFGKSNMSGMKVLDYIEE